MPASKSLLFSMRRGELVGYSAQRCKHLVTLMNCGDTLTLHRSTTSGGDAHTMSNPQLGDAAARQLALSPSSQTKCQWVPLARDLRYRRSPWLCTEPMEVHSTRGKIDP